jgi:hypothetical protein
LEKITRRPTGADRHWDTTNEQQVAKSHQRFIEKERNAQHGKHCPGSQQGQANSSITVLNNVG